MKLVLGMEEGLSPGDFVLDEDPAPSPKRGRSPVPNFRLISIVAKLLDASKCHLVWMLASAKGPVFFSQGVLLWSPYVIGQTIIFLPCGYYLSIFFYFLA